MTHLLTIILASLLLSGCKNTPSAESVQAEFLKFCSQFSDYSYVDWTRANGINTRQYSADWSTQEQSLIDSTGFPGELAAEYWLRLMNVKALLHKKSLPFRSFKDTRVNEAVDSLEQGFDKVFTRMISQEYYMRVFPDCFDEVIPPLVDRLVMCKHFEN